jgi:uncharacterized membrane protein YhaH (DUF805 family)
MGTSEIKASIRHGFGGLTRFSGRDTRRSFWPYAIFLFLATSALSYIAMIPDLMRMMTGVIELVEEADRDRAAGLPVAAPFPGKDGSLPPELIPDFTNTFLLTGALNAIAILLIAAAVTRRLHDRGRAGYWGLMPLPFSVIGLVFAGRMVDQMMRAPLGGGSPLVSLLMLNAAAYWALLAFLVVLLVGDGTKGPNRFGPEPPL